LIFAVSERKERSNLFSFPERARKYTLGSIFAVSERKERSNLFSFPERARKEALLIFAANEPSEASPEPFVNTQDKLREGAPELPMGFFTEFTLNETNVFRMTTKKCYSELTGKYAIWPIFLLKLL